MKCIALIQKPFRPRAFIALSVVLAMVLISGSLKAQPRDPFKYLADTQISAGYWANLGIQPGLRVGVISDLKMWSADPESQRKWRYVFIQPQLGFYNRNLNNANLYIGMDAGIELERAHGKFFSAYSIGLGYLGRSQILGITYGLGDGRIIERDREWRNYAFPTLNISIGSGFTPSLGWYLKLSPGYLLSTNQEGTFVAFLELGLRFRSKPKPVLR